jgi:geranylgeranyl diphosphate synthase type II
MMNERYASYKDRIEAALAGAFSRRGFSYDGLLEAVDYSLMAGGKRLRPVLVLEFCRIAGGDVEAALPVACAVEMLHTYSLIHDDLPCMDNDELRRGKPTNHVKFGECTAVLAGDALQAEAFGTILRAPLSAGARADCAGLLAAAAGIDGICGGQYLDMLCENSEHGKRELTDMQSRKTGSLLIAACRMGVAAARGGERELDAAARYGAALGAAFQKRDDMLAELGSEEELGKPVGSKGP